MSSCRVSFVQSTHTPLLKYFSSYHSLLIWFVMLITWELMKLKYLFCLHKYAQMMSKQMNPHFIEMLLGCWGLEIKSSASTVHIFMLPTQMNHNIFITPQWWMLTRNLYFTLDFNFQICLKHWLIKFIFLFRFLKLFLYNQKYPNIAEVCVLYCIQCLMVRAWFGYMILKPWPYIKK